MIKIRGSSSAFMWGRTVYTDYASGCLRAVYLASKGVKDEIDEKHTVRGQLSEDTHEEALKTANVSYERELVVTAPIEDALFSGRVDFVITQPDGTKLVHELKSSESKSRLTEIKKGEWKTNHLAQLVSYMDQIGTVNGLLVYSFWTKDKDTGEYQKSLEKSLQVTIDNYGRIVVDSVPTKFTVYDLYAHQYHVAKVQREDLIWDRPHNYDLLWGSPCGYCPFKATCGRWDKGEIKDVVSFVSDAQQSLRKGNQDEHAEV